MPADLYEGDLVHFFFRDIRFKIFSFAWIKTFVFNYTMKYVKRNKRKIIFLFTSHKSLTE